ncbi:MAG: hypothetical protein IJW36_01805 [Clostridia bacterium]|nr:hypothetical protein [Clostridia bacterium]
MSNFEIALIVLACAVPVVALLFVLPKFKKKEKKAPAPVKTLEEVKKEEKVETKTEPPKEKNVENVFTNNDFTSEDFKGYLNHKQKKLTKPARVDLPADFMDRTEPYIPRRRRRMEEKPKSVAEEIRSLSPELKALIFTGALDKKNFDCD